MKDEADRQLTNSSQVSEAETAPAAVNVPFHELSPSALRGVIEAFVLREGTDYGETDVPLASKIEDVMDQLERGTAQIVFDPSTESVDIVPAEPSKPSR